MNYEDTDLYFLQRDVCRAFAMRKGKRSFAGHPNFGRNSSVPRIIRTARRMRASCSGWSTRSSPIIRRCSRSVIGWTAALGLVRNETEKAAEECAERLANQMRPLFPYHAFRRNIKNFIEYRFPSRGWKSEGLEAKGPVISFRIAECFYYNITRKFGCPELCPVFCEYEARAFAGLSPQILFECGGTLANGHNFCDFCFRKGHGKRK